VPPQELHRACRGRSVSVVDPQSRISRARACPHRRSSPPHPGQASSPAARSASARCRSTIPITKVSCRHSARAWSITPPARQRPTGVGPTQQPNPSTVETAAGLRIGTGTTSRLARSRTKPPDRHGGGANECPRHVLDIVTVDGAKPNPRRRPRWRLTFSYVEAIPSWVSATQTSLRHTRPRATATPGRACSPSPFSSLRRRPIDMTSHTGVSNPHPSGKPPRSQPGRAGDYQRVLATKVVTKLRSPKYRMSISYSAISDSSHPLSRRIASSSN